MNKKTLIFSLLIAILSVIFAWFVISNQQHSDIGQNQIGNMLFENTVKEGLLINKIIIKTTKMQVTLQLEDKFWHVKEADNYYASLISINTFLKAVNEAKIQTVIQNTDTKEMHLAEPVKKDTPNAGISIQTYKDNRIVDNIIIGSRQNNFYTARFADSKQPLLVSGNFDLPDKLFYWLQQPLMMLDAKNVETVITQSETGQQLAFRPEMTSPFYNVRQEPTNIDGLLDQFTMLTFTTVKAAENTPLKDVAPNKTIVIFLESGLIYGVEVYENEGAYWVKINLSTNTLPTKYASDYIKDSSFLYQNWFFKISPQVGKHLIKYTIH